MYRDFKKYYQAWELRQQGKKLREIARLMGFKSKENARRMIKYIELIIEEKPWRITKELGGLIKKYGKKNH